MLVVIVGMISLFGVSVGTLIPAWAVKILHGNATTNVLLQSARGVGAVGSALLIAALGGSIRRGYLLTFGHLRGSPRHPGVCSGHQCPGFAAGHGGGWRGDDPDH